MDKIELDVNTMKTMIQEMKTMMAQAHSLQIKQTEVSKGKWNALGQDWLSVGERDTESEGRWDREQGRFDNNGWRQ